MNDRDINDIRTAIKNGRSFRIGQHGICVEFRFNGFVWNGSINRADTLIRCAILRVTEDGGAISCEVPGFNYTRILLDKYDKLTLL